MFEVTGRGDVFVRARTYDAMISAATLGALRRAYARAASMVAADRPQRVLDIGCGTGTMALAVKRCVPNAEVHAIDPSERMLDAARRNGVRAGAVVHFQAGWAQDLPYPNGEFDVVTLACTLRHIPTGQHVQILGEAARVLRTGGLLLIVELAPRGPARVLPIGSSARVLGRYPVMLRAAGFDSIDVGRVTPLLLGYVRGRRVRRDHFVIASAVDASPAPRTAPGRAQRWGGRRTRT